MTPESFLTLLGCSSTSGAPKDSQLWFRAMNGRTEDAGILVLCSETSLCPCTGGMGKKQQSKESRLRR